jgi:hypothetical protein
MVNAARGWDDRWMRRSIVLAILPVLVACSSSNSRDFARYYDPDGRFSTNLPAANDITVAPPQPAGASGPSIVAGVIASPPQPSPSAQGGFGGGLGSLGQAQSADQTIYEAFLVTTDTFPSLSAMTLYYLTSDPSIDVQLEQAVDLGGSAGRLVVADAVRNGSAAASLAVALSLGHGGTGYLLAAIFPPGTWDHESADFLRVLGSFRSNVPPGLATVPLASGPS